MEKFNLEDCHHLIQGYFCYAPDNEDDLEYAQNLLNKLIKYHETTPDELSRALAYYKEQRGERPYLPYYDPDFRDEFINQ